MRVGFDGKRYFNNKTGLGNYSREIVHALAAQFPDDEFVLFSETENKPFVEFKNLSVFTPKKKGLFWRVFGMAKTAAAQKIDVFHGLSNELPTGLKKYGIRSVVTIHDVIFKRYPGFYPLTDRLIYNWKTKNALRNADVVVATSHATAADIQNYYPSFSGKCEVVYQPVQQIFYDTIPKKSLEESPYFIYVSGFSHRKNHGTLIEAFAAIQNLCDWNLYLVGASGNTLDEVKKFVDHEKLGTRIRVITDPETRDLMHLMKHASAFVYPSLFEGFGIPLAEAAVCGLPMAVSDIPVFRELAGDAAFYFHPNKFREMADALLRLTQSEHSIFLKSSNPEILKEIERNHIAKHLMKIYRN